MSNLVSKKEAMSLLSISKRTFERWCRAGKLKRSYREMRVYVSRASVDRVIKDRKQA